MRSVSRLVALALVLVAGSGTATAGTISGTVEGAGTGDRVVVYVEGPRGRFPAPKSKPEVIQADLQFSPQTLAVVVGTTVAFPNHDSVLHSAFSLSKSNPFDLGIYGQGAPKTVTFKTPGLVEVFCHLHSEMRAFILVLENPYFATVGSEGRFRIENVPDGRHTVRAWLSPARTASRPVTVSGTETEPLTLTLGRN